MLGASVPVVSELPSCDHYTASPRVKMVATVVLILIIAWSAEGLRVRRQGFIDLNEANRCKNPRGEPGVCLPIRQCDQLVNLLVTQRQQTEVVTFLRQSVCGYQGLDPKVCCPQTQDRTGNTTPTSLKDGSSTTTTVASTTLSINNGSPGPSSLRLPIGKGCGDVEVKNTRVVGGTNATLGAWPWMGALGYQSSSGGSSPVFLCAGSLITNKHVLTAAHCLANKRKLLIVRLGDLNLYSDSDGATPLDARVSRTIVHENYSPTAYTNDIGLVELASPVQFREHIRPICLPITQDLRSKDYVNRKPFIAGWGSVSYSGPSSPTLLELQIPVVTEARCKDAFASFKTATIDKRVLCAGLLRGGKDACRGDSGGPLMDYNNPDKLYYQIGVVSYGYKCAEPGFPGIYTRVTEFVDWIRNKVEGSS